MSDWGTSRPKNWDEVQDLIRMGTEESLVLDFKSEPYAHPKKPPEKKREDRLELRRDVASFANASGGTLILGIAEDEHGQASRIVGVEDVVSSQKFVTEVLSRDIEPAFGSETPRIRVLRSPPEQNLSVVLIEVEPSRPGRPRAVLNNDLAEFWIRAGKSKRPMTNAQIEEGFHGDASVQEQRSIDAQAKREVMRIRYQLGQEITEWVKTRPLLEQLSEYVSSASYGSSVAEAVLDSVYDVLAFARAKIPYALAERSCNLVLEALPIHSLVGRAPLPPTEQEIELLHRASSEAVNLIYEATRRLRDIILINTGAKLLHDILRYAHLNELSILEAEILADFEERISWAEQDEVKDGPELLRFYRDNALSGWSRNEVEHSEAIGWLVWESPEAFPEHYRRDGS